MPASVTAASPCCRSNAPAGLDLHWLDSEADLAQALRSMPLPAGEGFAWCAAEAATAAGLREVLAAKGLPKDAMRVAAYWKRGAVAHHENLDDAA